MEELDLTWVKQRAEGGGDQCLGQASPLVSVTKGLGCKNGCEPAPPTSWWAWCTTPIFPRAAYLGAALALGLRIHCKELLNHFNLQIVIQRCVIVFRAAGLRTREEGDQVKSLVLVSPEGGRRNTFLDPQIQLYSSTFIEELLPMSCVN